MELKIPSKFSRSRLPSCCSAVPTVRKRRDLATGVEDDDHDRRPCGFIGACACAADDQTEIRDRGIGEHLFPIGLGNGRAGSEEEGDPAHQHCHDADMIVSQDRRELDDEEDARLDHGRRVQERRGRRRCHHRPQKPSGEGHHRRFRKSAEDEERCDKLDRFTAAAQIHQERQLDRVVFLPQKDDRQCKGKPAQKVHPERLAGIVDRFIRLRIADQEEGAERRDLPEGVHEEQIVRHDKAKHRRKEEKDHKEEKAAPVRDPRMLSMVLRHVAQGVHCDESADDAGDQDHDDGKVIDEEIP